MADLLDQVGAGHLPFLCAADLPQAVDFLLDRLSEERGRLSPVLPATQASGPADSLEQAAADFVTRARTGEYGSLELGGRFSQLALALVLRVQAAIWAARRGHGEG